MKSESVAVEEIEEVAVMATPAVKSKWELVDYGEDSEERYTYYTCVFVCDICVVVFPES